MSQIPAFNPASTAIAGAENRFAEMSSEDFVRIMFAELENQDPFQPNDSAALLEQLNTIRSIESDVSLVERLDSLVFENQLSSASNLIGKTVSGLTPALQRTAGQVVSVVRQADNVFVELDNGAFMPVNNVEMILNSDENGTP